MLEHSGPAGRQISQTLGWITRGVKPLSRAAGMLAVILVLLFAAALGLQYVLMNMVLPAMTGLAPTEARLTMSGLGWTLAFGFALFCAFDLYWHVAAVMLFYHLAGWRLGTDLQQRLAAAERYASSQDSAERDPVAV